MTSTLARTHLALRFSRTTTAVGVVVLALLVGFYLHGTFDRALSGVGLNFNECGRNGFGATFCGSELDRYRERTNALDERLRAVQANLKARTSE